MRPTVSSSVGSSASPPPPLNENVRWLFMEDDKVWCLIPDVAADSVTRELVGDVPLECKSRVMADFFGKAQEWARHEFEFDESTLDLSLVDTDPCRRLE